MEFVNTIHRSIWVKLFLAVLFCFMISPSSSHALFGGKIKSFTADQVMISPDGKVMRERNLWDVPQFISLYRQELNIDFLLKKVRCRVLISALADICLRRYIEKTCQDYGQLSLKIQLPVPILGSFPKTTYLWDALQFITLYRQELNIDFLLRFFHCQ